MTKIEAAKAAAKFVVGSSVTFTVANALRNNVLPTNSLQSVERGIASAVVGWMVAEKAEAFTSAKIDEAVDWWKTNVTKN